MVVVVALFFLVFAYFKEILCVRVFVFACFSVFEREIKAETSKKMLP